MRVACCALVALSACYAPMVVGGAPCDPAGDSCPTGQSCLATGGGGGVCRVGDLGPDAGIDATGGGSACLGNGLLGKLCFSTAPTAPIQFAGTVSIVTSTVGGNNCSEIRAQPGGPSLCIVAGTSVDVPTGVTVRAIGANPLVLVATRTITIAGGLDVASHSGVTLGGAPVLGAGARTALECAALGLDGQPGRDAGTAGDYGGGGAAGGSFGGPGGAGGTGGNNGDVGRGNPVASAAPGVLLGGCPGGHGGESSGGGAGGPGGNAGGAIYLLAGDSIAVAGNINASGGGGGAGGTGTFSSGGGGGGGAGGMIGLEAPHITVQGSLYANGGGGGAGGGSEGNGDGGEPGADPTLALLAALGGSGTNNGGAGGNGAGGTLAAEAGKNGGGPFPECGGGGGGGGAGVIRVFGVPPGSLAGSISPTAR